MKNSKTRSKKFNPFHYKGYMAVLLVLFVILILLVNIAIGMIKETYPSNEEVQQSMIEPESKAAKETKKKESIVQDTVAESETESETETKNSASSETESESSDERKILEIRVDTQDPLLILVNRDNPVPADIQYTLIQISEEHSVDERIYKDLIAMLEAAKKEGYELEVCSSWRSRELQEKLYANKLDEYLSYGYSTAESKELAAFWVALPGTSEHEIGLAVDIVSKHYQLLDHSQADTAEQQWLMAHCHEYGFILRYPQDKQEITHIGYEPWHYRYVGKAAAKEIVELDVCLEEYLQLPTILVEY